MEQILWFIKLLCTSLVKENTLSEQQDWHRFPAVLSTALAQLWCPQSQAVPGGCQGSSDLSHGPSMLLARLGHFTSSYTCHKLLNSAFSEFQFSEATYILIWGLHFN